MDMDAVIERRLPPAPPYPWIGDANRANSVPATATDLRSSSFGGRVRSLQSRLGGSGTGDDAGGARSVLDYLLSKHGGSADGVVGRGGGGEGTTSDGASEGQRQRPRQHDDGKGRSSPPLPPPPPPAILFESILGLFPGPSAEVAADTIVRAVVRTVNPADVPAEMDGVQLVLAALMFLSSPLPALEPPGDTGNAATGAAAAAAAAGTTPPPSSLYGRKAVTDAFPALPLLLCTNNKNNDAALAKRRYKRHPSIRGDWSLDDAQFRGKVRRLESAFLTSTPAHPTRYRSCPRMDARAEAVLLRTGMVPPPPTAAGAKSSLGPSKSAGGGSSTGGKGKRKSEATDGGGGSAGQKKAKGGVAAGGRPPAKVPKLGDK